MGTSWFIITTMSIAMVMSNTLTLSPEYTIVDVGKDSVNFKCTIELEVIEAVYEHWIIWWKDNTRIVDNDMVITNSGKYSVQGVSAAIDVNYTQSLQVHGIEETDHGIYTCNLILESIKELPAVSSSSYAALIITNLFPQPVCSNITVELQSEQQLTLICTRSPGDHLVRLHWIDHTGSYLTSGDQMAYKPLTLTYVPMQSDASNQWFTCRATNTISMDSKECVIGNKDPTSMATTSDTSRAVTSTQWQTTEVPLSKLQSDVNDIKTTQITTRQNMQTEAFVANVVTNGITINHQSSVSPAVNDRITVDTTLTISITTLTPIIPEISVSTVTEQNRPTSVDMQTETSTASHDNHTTSIKSTSNKLTSSSSDDNTPVVIIVGILAGICVIGFIVMLIVLKTKYEKKKNEEIHLNDCPSVSIARHEIKVENDMYAQFDRSSTSISNRINTQEEAKNNKQIQIQRNCNKFIDADNDDTYATVSDIVPTKSDENKKDTEVNKVDAHGGDNVSRTSVDSSASIHYEVDYDAVYTKVLKPQKTTAKHL